MERSRRGGAGVLREGEAAPETHALLEEIRVTMGLPWLPFTWEVYARQPAVLRLFWDLLGEITASELFVRESLAISGSVHLGITSWYRPDPDFRYPPGDAAGLSRELDAFEFGYPQLLIQQAALAHLLRGQPVGAEGNALPRAHPSAFLDPALAYPAWDDLGSEARAAARDLRLAWSLPRPVADILALAKRPSFLGRAVSELRALRLRPEYRTLRKGVADMGEDALERVRPGVSLREGELRAALEESTDWPAGSDRLKDQVLSFTLALPGMILDNALLRLAAAAWRPAEAAGEEVA